MIKGTVELPNGETMFYREMGQGDETLLLIHGNMSSSKHWEPVYEKMKDRYKIYAVDLRGMGESSYHNSFDTLKELTDDVAAFCKALNIKKTIAVGWSTGGGIVMELAADYPELVKKGILIESVSYKGYPIFKKNEKGEPIPGEFYSSKEEMAKDPIQVVPALQAMESGDRETIRMIWDAAIYVVEKPSDEKYEEYLTAILQQRNLIDVDWALANFNLSNEHNGMTEGNGKIQKIKQPMLLFGAELDYVVPKYMVEETAEALAENAEMHMFKNSGHSPITDVTEELIEKIEEFIQ